MGHGGYGKRRIPDAANSRNRRESKPKSLAVDKKSKSKSKPKAKAKAVSIKNQMRSIERMLRKVYIFTPFSPFVFLVLLFFICR